MIIQLLSPHRTPHFPKSAISFSAHSLIYSRPKHAPNQAAAAVAAAAAAAAVVAAAAAAATAVLGQLSSTPEYQNRPRGTAPKIGCVSQSFRAFLC